LSKDVLEIVSSETISPELNSLDAQVVQQWGEFQKNRKLTAKSRKRLAETLCQMHEKLANHGDGTWRKYLEDRSINFTTAWRLMKEVQHVEQRHRAMAERPKPRKPPASAKR
jgi:hypothetical protein